MASVKIILRTNKVNRQGLAPLMIQLIHDRKTSEISLQKYIDPKHWNHNDKAIRKSYPSHSTLNVYLNKERRAFEKAVDDLLALGLPFTVKDIQSQREGKQVISKEAITLAEYLENYIIDNPENLGWGTLKYYTTVQRRVKEFNKDLKLTEVTQEVIEEFWKYLIKQGNSVNTIHTRLKVIRKMIKLAFKKELIQIDPFLHIQLKQEPSKREYLTEEEFQRLKQLTPKTALQQLVLDTFLFSCYTGIRFGDICSLTADNVIKYDNNQKDSYRIHFKMAKTKEVISFKLPGPAVDFIMKYNFTKKKGNDLLFPIIKNRNRIKTNQGLLETISARNALFNKVLKSLAEQAGISKNLSTHIARHTFATLSLSFGISMEILSKLMGHSDLSTTQIYAKIMDKAKDDAMDLWKMK